MIDLNTNITDHSNVLVDVELSMTEGTFERGKRKERLVFSVRCQILDTPTFKQMISFWNVNSRGAVAAISLLGSI